MESIEVVTGQFVTIKYEPASVVRRGLALAVDYVVMIAYALCTFYFVTEVWLELVRTIAEWAIVVLLLPILCYNFLFEALTGGQTPGKMLLRIRVTATDGSSPGLLAYFLRWLLLMVDLLPSFLGIGMFFILFTERHQRLGDLAAGTIVVRNAKPMELDIDRDFMEYSPSYVPSFPQVELLSDGQIRFITRLLFDIRDQQATTPTVVSLAEKVKENMKVETDLTPREFLETVVRDYNYYTLQIN